jgi:hypothetical protein
MLQCADGAPYIDQTCWHCYVPKRQLHPEFSAWFFEREALAALCAKLERNIGESLLGRLLGIVGVFDQLRRVPRVGTGYSELLLAV